MAIVVVNIADHKIKARVIDLPFLEGFSVRRHGVGLEAASLLAIVGIPIDRNISESGMDAAEASENGKRLGLSAPRVRYADRGQNEVKRTIGLAIHTAPLA